MIVPSFRKAPLSMKFFFSMKFQREKYSPFLDFKEFFSPVNCLLHVPSKMSKPVGKKYLCLNRAYMYHPTSPCLIICNPTSPCLIICHPTSPCLIICNPTSPCLIICNPTSPCLTICNPTSPCLTIYYAQSYFTMPHYA